MFTDMNITPADVSSYEGETPVLASENQYEHSTNQRIASADFEEAPVIANEDQFDDSDDSYGPVPANENQFDDSDEEAPVPANEDQDDDSDKESVASGESEEVEEEEQNIEPFEEYKPKLERLLVSIGFPQCDIEALQHDMKFQNCVYALTSQANSEDKYILRVPMEPELREDDGVCEAVLNDAALLGYLTDNLSVPVPRVVAYSATRNNVLEEPYMLQTRLPGVALDHVFERMTHEQIFAIIDQYVDLIAKLEAVTFDTAGSFMASALEPISTTDFSPLGIQINFFRQGDEEYVEKPEAAIDRAGQNVKTLLVSHIDGRLETERKYEKKYSDDTGRVPYYNKMKEILEKLDFENEFDQPQPIVLHHWDLEARNVMVTSTPEGYKITGIIDWDSALAYPRVLGRRAPDWIWDFRREDFTGYKDTDFHPNLNLSDESLALKKHFDEKACSVLGDQYLDDAYGIGSLLRRIWYVSKEPLYNTSDFYLMVDICNEWEDKLAKPEAESEEVPEAVSEDLPEPASEDLPEPMSEVSPEPASEISPEPVPDVSPAPVQDTAEPELALDKPPMSQQLTAVPVAVPEPQRPAGL
ncbi:MAG: hypothetical protein Q9221_008181 [Calogaya cf. arnoldii]